MSILLSLLSLSLLTTHCAQKWEGVFRVVFRQHLNSIMAGSVNGAYFGKDRSFVIIFEETAFAIRFIGRLVVQEAVFMEHR